METLNLMNLNQRNNLHKGLPSKKISYLSDMWRLHCKCNRLWLLPHARLWIL